MDFDKLTHPCLKIFPTFAALLVAASLMGACAVVRNSVEDNSDTNENRIEEQIERDKIFGEDPREGAS